MDRARRRARHHARARRARARPCARVERRGQRPGWQDHAQGLRPARRGLRHGLQRPADRGCRSCHGPARRGRLRIGARSARRRASPRSRRRASARPGRRWSHASTRTRRRRPRRPPTSCTQLRDHADPAAWSARRAPTSSSAAPPRRRSTCRHVLGEQAAAVHRRRGAALGAAAARRVPLARDPGAGGASMNLLSIGASLGVVVAVFQWGWLGGVFGVTDGADRRVHPGDAVRDRVRPVDGLRGVPRIAHPRAWGAARDTSRAVGRRSRQHRPSDHRRGDDHGLRLPVVRARGRPRASRCSVSAWRAPCSSTPSWSAACCCRPCSSCSAAGHGRSPSWLERRLPHLAVDPPAAVPGPHSRRAPDGRPAFQES